MTEVAPAGSCSVHVNRDGTITIHIVLRRQADWCTFITTPKMEPRDAEALAHELVAAAAIAQELIDHGRDPQ